MQKACNLRILIHRQLMKSIYADPAFHTENKSSSMGHIQQQLATSVRKRPKLKVVHIYFQPKLSCHQQLIETLAVQVHFLDW